MNPQSQAPRRGRHIPSRQEPAYRNCRSRADLESWRSVVWRGLQAEAGVAKMDQTIGVGMAGCDCIVATTTCVTGFRRWVCTFRMKYRPAQRTRLKGRGYRDIGKPGRRHGAGGQGTGVTPLKLLDVATAISAGEKVLSRSLRNNADSRKLKSNVQLRYV